MYGIWTLKSMFFGPKVRDSNKSLPTLLAAILVSFSPQAAHCFGSLGHFLNGREGWRVGGEGDSLLRKDDTH